MIDKLIGDEVMALYLPIYVAESSWSPDDADRRTVATVMLEHARGLLEGLGYGGSGGPVLDLGIGLDYGEAFVGNIGGNGRRERLHGGRGCREHRGATAVVRKQRGGNGG